MPIVGPEETWLLRELGTRHSIGWAAGSLSVGGTVIRAWVSVSGVSQQAVDTQNGAVGLYD